MPNQAVALLLASLSAGEPARASLDIDASALGEAGAAMEDRLVLRGERVLRDEDVLPGQGAGDALITIRIDTLADVIGYRYAYTVTRGGELVAGLRGSAECRTCNEAELAEQLDDALERLAERLQPEADEPPGVPTPAHVAVPDPVATTALRGWNVTPLGGTGIVLTGVGGVALGVGVGLAIAEPLLLEGNAGRSSTVAVAGLAVAVTGAAMAASGVAMMLIDRSRSRRSTARWTGATLRF